MINGHYIKAIDTSVKVYYNRPLIQNVTSYNTYDEGWMYANGIDSPSGTPINAIFQQPDYSVSPDYLKYYNAFGHKFRFTGLNGGYYDFNDATYKNVTGGTSSFVAEFQAPVDTTSATANDGYIIDHLTGLGWRSVRWGSGGVTYYTCLAGISITTLSSWNLHPYDDWKVPTLRQAETLYRFDIPNNASASHRPPFQYDQPDIWCSTTYPTSTGSTYQPNFAGPFSYTASKTAAGSANQCGIRYHYSRTDYVLQP